MVQNLVAQVGGGRHPRKSHSRMCMDCAVGNGRRRGRSCHGGSRLVQILRHDRGGGGLHHDGEDGSPRPSLEAPSQLCLPFETILSSRQSFGELWKAMNGVVQGCSFGLVTVACITGLWMGGTNQQVPEITATTMVDDRRLYAVGTEKFRILHEKRELPRRRSR